MEPLGNVAEGREIEVVEAAPGPGDLVYTDALGVGLVLDRLDYEYVLAVIQEGKRRFVTAAPGSIVGVAADVPAELGDLRRLLFGE